MTAKEYAALLGMSEWAVYNAVREGRGIPHVRSAAGSAFRATRSVGGWAARAAPSRCPPARALLKGRQPVHDRLVPLAMRRN